MTLSQFSPKARSTPEQTFWKWFLKNDERLFHFEKDQEANFDHLAKEMKKLHESMTFEFGPIREGAREFVISADGIKDAFPVVERLYSSAPQSDRWTFIKFRPHRTPMNVTYGGITVKTEDVFCTLERSRDKVAVTVYIRGYQPKYKQAYLGIAFLMLDQALGEHDVETKVGFIEVKDDLEASALQKKPIREVTQVFDRF